MADLTLLYYTANRAPARLADGVRADLLQSGAGYPLVSVSQQPLDFGENVCVGDIGFSPLNVYRQILAGALTAQTPYVACCEDDTLYDPSHFAYRPERGVIAYNMNRWHLDPTTPPQFRWRNRTGMCACVADREALIETLNRRFQADPDGTKHPKSWGEPGRYEWVFGIPPVERVFFQTRVPIVHLNHGGLHGIRKGVAEDMVRQSLHVWGRASEVWGRYAA